MEEKGRGKTKVAAESSVSHKMITVVISDNDNLCFLIIIATTEHTIFIL